MRVRQRVLSSRRLPGCRSLLPVLEGHALGGGAGVPLPLDPEVHVSGLEFLKTVKGDAQLRAIPVVVLTSSREERDLVESYRLPPRSRGAAGR